MGGVLRESFVVSILSYNRVQELKVVLQDLERERVGWDVEVQVFDDCSFEYSEIEELCKVKGYEYTRAEENYGRRRHWAWVTKELQSLKDKDADFFVFLPDDCRLVKGFFRRALDAWSACGCDALNLMYGETRQLGPPLDSAICFNMGWVDGLFVCQRSLLEALDYRVPPVHDKWLEVVERGTGVGASMSQILQDKGMRMYGVVDSLVWLQETRSVMNAWRDKDPQPEVKSLSSKW